MSRPSGSEVEALLDELCTSVGLCVSHKDRARLVQSPPASVDSFTDAVFAAEGLDPRFHGHLHHRVRMCVVRWFDRLSPMG
jgi:hypothetical protein